MGCFLTWYVWSSFALKKIIHLSISRILFFSVVMKAVVWAWELCFEREQLLVGLQGRYEIAGECLVAQPEEVTHPFFFHILHINKSKYGNYQDVLFSARHTSSPFIVGNRYGYLHIHTLISSLVWKKIIPYFYFFTLWEVCALVLHDKVKIYLGECADCEPC